MQQPISSELQLLLSQGRQNVPIHFIPKPLLSHLWAPGTLGPATKNHHALIESVSWQAGGNGALYFVKVTTNSDFSKQYPIELRG